MSKSWKAYMIDPIDWGWERLKTVAETLSDIAADYNDEFDETGDVNKEEVEKFIFSWLHAKQAAKEVGWEGDFREPPRVFWLPGDNHFEYGFAFKQDNNGTTFVVSPQPLPGIEERP